MGGGMVGPVVELVVISVGRWVVTVLVEAAGVVEAGVVVVEAVVLPVCGSVGGVVVVVTAVGVVTVMPRQEHLNTAIVLHTANLLNSVSLLKLRSITL